MLYIFHIGVLCVGPSAVRYVLGLDVFLWSRVVGLRCQCIQLVCLAKQTVCQTYVACVGECVIFADTRT